MAQIKLAEYTFDNSVGDVMPSLTPNTITMTKEDSVNGTITRRIVYIDDSVMPTQIGGFFQSTALLTLDYLNVTNSVTTIESMFYQATNVTYINVSNWDTSNVTKMQSAFYQCTKLQTIEGLENWNVSKNTTFSMTFYRCEKLQEANITNWKAPLCTNMYQMFRQCYALKNLDLSGFEVSTTSGVDMSRCFQQCDKLKITGLNTMKVKPSNLTWTFANLSSAEVYNNFDLSTWDTSLCTNFGNMFEYGYSIETINVSNWDMSSATSLSSMFNTCSNLKHIRGLDTWDVSSVTNFDSMFYECSSLTKLDLRNWITSSVTSFQDMFNSCSSLEVIRVDNFDTSKVTGTGLNAMFSDCKKVKTLNLNSFVNAGLGNFINFCYNCESLEYISAQNFIWGNCNALQGTFTNCKKLKMLDLTNFDGTTIATTAANLRLANSFKNITCPIYYNSNMCTANDTELTNKSNAIDVKGRLMAVYDFNNTATTSDSAYPTLTGSTVTKTIDTQGSESHITHRVIGVDVMPTAISFQPVTGLLNVDYLAVTSSCTGLQSLFQDCVRLDNVNTFGWDTSNVANMAAMFIDCGSLKSIDLSNLNTSSCTTLLYLFQRSGIESLDLSSWDVSHVEDMSAAFGQCYSLTQLNIKGWDTSSATSMDYMFAYSSNLVELDLTSFNTSKCTWSENVFTDWTSDQIVYVHDTNWIIDVSSYNATFVRRLSKLLAKYTFDNTTHPNCLPRFNKQAGIGTTVDYIVSDIVKDNITTRLLSTDGDLPQHIQFADDDYTGGRGIISCDYLDTSNCTSLYLLFYDCSTLTSVNTSSWDTSKVTNFYCTFFGTRCTEIDCSNIDTSSATSINRMFDSCSILTSLDLSSWDVSKVTDFGKLFSGCYGLKSLNISGWDTSSAVSMNDMFLGCGLTELDVSHFNTSNVTNLSSMFAGVKIPSIDLSGWDVRKVQQTRLMFNSGSITEIKLDGWNTESLTDMWAMFCDSAITTVDINHFNVSKVTNASQLFDNCQSLVSVDMSNLHFTSCESISSMFSGCPKLTTVKMADFTGSPLNGMTSFCHNAKKLTEIDVSTFDTSRVTNLQNIFSACSSLVSLDLSSWDVSQCTDMNNMFNGCSSLTSLDLSSWNTDNVTSTYLMFNNCSSIEELDLSSFTTTKLTNIEYMLERCSSLKTLDISNFNLDKFSPTQMFYSTKNIESIGLLYVSSHTINLISQQISKDNTNLQLAPITIYYYDADPTQLTPVEGVTFKKYQTPTTIQLPPHIQLHSLPDGTRDELDIKTGILTRNVKCYDMIKVSEDGTRTYYMLDEEFVEKVEPVIVNSESGSITMSEFLSGDGDISANVDYITDDEGMITQAMFVANNHDKEDEYFIMKTTGSGNVLNTFTKATDCTVTYQEGNGFLVKSNPSVQYNIIRIENMNFEVGKTYNFKLELTTQATHYQSVNNLRMISNTSNIQYTNIFANSGLNTDGTLILKGQYTHAKSNYTVLSMSFKVALDKDGGFLSGKSPSYFVKITVSEAGSGDAPHLKLSYPNITLNKVLNCADELNLLTGEITRKVGVRPSKPTEKYTQLPLVEPSSYTTYKKEKLITKLTTPTTEQLILNYNNSCDYGRILPTGMCDKYSVVDSMYTQTMTSILLDGANTWDAMEEFENTVKFTATGTTVGVENLNMLGAGGLYCDNDLFPNINDDSDVPHCRVDEAGNKFYIYVDKEMLMSPDLIGWQIWLQANPFNLIYELAEHLTYVKPYEELDPTQARWEGMDCMRDGAIKYHANNSDNITMYPTLEYVAPSINNFEVTMLEPNTDYTIYAEGINEGDTINFGGTDVEFANATVFTSGDNQWLRVDNNDSFYNMVVTKGDTTGEHVPYFEGMVSVKMPVLTTTGKNLFNFDDLEADSTTRRVNKSYIRFDETKPFSFSMPGYVKENGTRYVVLHCYDDEFNYLGRVSLGDMLAKYENRTVLTGTKYIKVDIDQVEEENPSDVFEAQLEYGKAATTYEPYKSNILTVNEEVELRGIGDVKDELNLLTGELTQRIGKVVITNSDIQLTNNTNYRTETSTAVLTYKNILYNIQGKIISADIPAYEITDYLYGLSKIDFGISFVNNSYGFCIRLPHNLTGITLSDGGEMVLEKFKEYLKNNPITVYYQLTTESIKTVDLKCVNQAGEVIDNLCAFDDGTIHLSSDTGLLPTTHYSVPSTNTFNLASMKTGTRYTLKYPSASGSITIGDINYSISSDSMLFTTPLKINGDTSAIIFSDANPENVVLLEGVYNKREVPFFTGVKSVKNPNITIIDQLSTESTTYNCETEIELRGLPNGVADKLDIIKGKLTTNVGIRPYQEGDENLPNIWTDGYETVYALSSPVVKNVTIDRPTVTTNSLIELSSDYLIPQLNYRAPSSNNFPLDLLQPNTTYTLYADTLASGSYTLGGTRTGVYSQPHTITLGDMTDNLLTFNGDLGLSNVMLVKGNSLKTTLPPYFLGIRSVTDGHLLVEGMAGEMNEITFDEGIVLRDCNGVKDTIDLITCTLTKRTGEITLTGAEGWYRADNESTTDHNVFKLALGGLKEALVMCDTLQSVFDTKMMDCIHAHTNELCIVIANATIGGNTVNALKSWLNQHPTTVVYQLRVPIEVQLENVWTTTPPTSYSNQTEISSTVSTNSLKPMISVTIATTTLEEIVSNLETRNTQLEEENMATMLALTSVYETMVVPMVASEPLTVNLSDGKDGNKVNGMSVSPIGMIYVKLIKKGFKTIEQVPANLKAEVIYALRD